MPKDAAGIVLFAHGRGSSRLSPRNRFVAGALNEAGFATLLFDLLTEAESRDRAKVFDIGLLAERLVAARSWLAGIEAAEGLRVGYFGSSTGAAAAHIAAAEEPQAIGAVVSRGGRPDLADDALAAVRAPTLLIVGGADLEVLDLNRKALARIECEKELAIVPDATHLFEEAGALEQVVEHAKNWFAAHLGAAGG